VEGWLEMDSEHCWLTVEGMLFLDHIVEQLVDTID
jgi:hypothetical protein